MFSSPTFITFNRVSNKIRPSSFSCKFSLNNVQQANKAKTYLSKEAKTFNKLIGNLANKKRKIFFEDAPPSGNFNLATKGHKENNRRVAVLNTLFMRHISDLLATSVIGGDVMDKGLEISRVSITPNFQQVNVFWSTGREDHALVLETSLPQVSYSLRHELTQLGVMGVVPRLVFIRDKSLSQASKVDYLLSVADYGEDHVPVVCSMQNFNKEDSTPIKPEEVKQTKSYEDDGSMSQPEPMPEMRQDIFGLDHSKMFNKIEKSLHKSRALHRFHPNIAIECEGAASKPEVQTSIDLMDKKQRKEAMAKFIQNRKDIEFKKRKNQYKSQLRTYEANEDDFEEDQLGVEDYIEEDDDIEQQKYKVS